jgi:membrane dipeptidase
MLHAIVRAGGARLLLPLLVAPACAHRTMSAEGPAARGVSDDVLAVHRAAIVVDGHSDTAQRLLDEGIDFGRRLPDGHMDLPRLLEGGVDGQFFAAWVDPDYAPDRAFARADRLLDAVIAMTRSVPGVELARTAADVRAIAARGHVAALLAVENGQAIENDLENLRRLAVKGVRYLTLTWMNSHEWADGSGGEILHYGLTDFGREVVREMERLGILVDVSHAADATFWDVLEIARNPVIASHSSTDALGEHHRSLNDQQLRAVAKNGGVVGINFYAAYVDPAFGAAAEEALRELRPGLDSLRAAWGEDTASARREGERLRAEVLAKLPPVPIARVADHVLHVIAVAGVDHVGLGSDFDGISATPQGLEDASRLPALTAELRARGLSDADLGKVLGGNFLRVLEAAEPRADPSAGEPAGPAATPSDPAAPRSPDQGTRPSGTPSG